MKRLSYIFFIMVVGLLLFTTSCNNNTKIDELKKQGKVITVRYESNGGTYLDREGITLIDAFNPLDYQKDANGLIHIKLVEPTSNKRPSSSNDGIYITKTNCFLIGWYTTRNIVTNSDNNPIDEEGNELVQIGKKYFLKSDNSIERNPIYTYSGYWDFSKNTIDYEVGSGEYDLTLYACWSNYFTFNYLQEKDGKWESIGETQFDYVTTNQEGSKTSDKDTIWIPRYEDGALVYTHKYLNNSTYNFPQVDGMSFTHAYLDAEKANEITDFYEHPGTIDYESGKAVNGKINIYCEFEKGVKYYISTPEQLVNNIDLNGIYEIQNDLDFTNVSWPTGFSLGTFNGKLYGKDNKNFELSNIVVHHAHDTSKVGGLFGQIGDEAVINNITFKNIEVDFSYVGMRNRNATFGLFSGIISEKANINDVSISGSLKIGSVAVDQTSSIYLVASGDTSKINVIDKIHLTIYGTLRGEEYNYTIDPESVKIENDGQITFKSVTSLKLSDSEKVIQ